MKLIFLTYLALQILHGRDSQVTGNHWSYAHSSKWEGTCHTDDGRQHRQSPVDIESIVPYSTAPFVFRNYGFINTTQTNNGHTLKVLVLPKSLLLLHQDPENLLGEEAEDEEEGPEAAEDARPQVLGGGLPGTYILHSFHFHWGSDSFKGSEHLLKGCAFAAEMHLVHFNKKYGSIQEALKHSDGLAVLGIWLTPAHATWRHSHLDAHATTSKADYYFAAGRVPVPGACTYTREEHEVSSHHWFDMITPHDNAEGEGRPTHVYLRQMLPFDTARFYRYEGSLTTPPCTENVIWTVFHEAVSVPEDFLEGLRSLVMPSHPHHQVSDNFRPPQSLSGRLIFSRGDSTMKVPASCERSRELHATCTDFPDIYFTSERDNEIEAEETMMELSCPDEEPSSPINLYLMQSDPHYSPALQWRPIGHCKGAKVVNDGDVLKVLYPTRSPEWELVGSNLTNAYHLAAIQLRWGSEHRLGGLSFPLEIQLMHYNSKYKTFQEALTRKDGLVMVSKFFQEPESEEITLDSMDGYQIRHNQLLAGIIEAVQKKAQAPLGHKGIRSPDIRHLMGDTSTYYEYKGSVGSITPDVCPSGTATWMVIRKTGHISRSQMESLREMQSWDGSAITSNNRPLASSTGRRVILRIDSRELAHEFKTMMKRRKRKTVKPPLAPTSVPESEHEQSLPRLSLQPQASRSAKSSSSASPPLASLALLLSSLSFLNLMTVIEKFRRCLGGGIFRWGRILYT